MKNNKSFSSPLWRVSCNAMTTATHEKNVSDKHCTQMVAGRRVSPDKQHSENK